MTRARIALLAFVAAVAGCPSAFDRDAAILDAGPDGGPDTPCPDRDGDGARDAACGGDDCDDGDAALGPAASRCVGPTTFGRCIGTERVEAGCAPGVCDARTGTCAGHACGDGVVHAGEVCDDGNSVEDDGCDSECFFSLCVSDADCPAAAPSCSDHQPDGTFRCRPLQAGLAVSERCTTDADCASGFCDPEQLRCSHGCMEDAECGEGESWCLWPERGTDPTTFIPGSHRCAYGCVVDGECPAGSACTMPEMGPLMPKFTFCRARNPTGGEFGSEHEVLAGGECAGWVYVVNSGLPIRGLCTRACADDADCAAPLPYCRYLRDSEDSPPRPASWRYAHFRGCREAASLPGGT